MANFRRIKIPTAVDGRYDHNLDFVHLTTQDFFGLRVLRAVEVMPNADFDIDLSVTGKCEPLVLPTYANVSTKVNAFFVPFRTVFQNWNAFINDTKERLYSTTAVPVYTMGRLVSALMKHVVLNDPTAKDGFDENGHVSSDDGFTGYLGDSSAKYDFEFVRDLYYGDEYFNNIATAQDTQTLHYYLNLDVNGRRIYNLLLGLGVKADLINFSECANKIVWHTSVPSDYNDENGNPFNVPYYDDDVNLEPGSNWLFPDSAWEEAHINSDGLSWDEDDELFDFNISFLPLACLAKVYSDWFTNSQFEYTVNVIEAVISTVEQAKIATSEQLETLFALIFNVTYDNDYFTSALVHPYGAGNTTLTLSNVDTGEGSDLGTAWLTGSENPARNGTAFHSGNLVSQYIHTAVHRLQDFARRNLLAGIRPVDRWLARWGIHLDNSKVNRSVWLGEYEQQFQISTVTQTSANDGSGKELGSYAAQMQSSTDRNGHFSFRNSDEFGMLIFTSVVVPHVGYFQGMDRHNFHIGLTDFFTPEFDAMDVQAIAEYELFAPSLYNPDAGAQKHEDIFGMTSRYAEYKNINDVVSGDYFFDSRNTGLDAWHLLRIIDAPSVYEESFTFGNVDAEQYKRIFAVTRGGFDPFKMFYNFKVHATMPAHKLFDDYEYDKRGRETEINALGTKLN